MPVIGEIPTLRFRYKACCIQQLFLLFLLAKDKGLNLNIFMQRVVNYYKIGSCTYVLNNLYLEGYVRI